MLRDAEFGTPLSPDFEHDHFDHHFWEWDSDDKYSRSLKLKSGRLPSAAIDALFGRLSEWHVDCDHLVQIANLYALRMTFGAARFNQREGLQMRLRSRESSGLGTSAHFGRRLPNDAWRFILEWRPPDDPRFGGDVGKSTDTLIAQAPAGSRVRFTNLGAPSSSDFKHENALKIGADRYAAAGFDDPITGNEFTRERLEIKMAQTTNPRPSWPYIRANVFIDEIEQFDVP